MPRYERTSFSHLTSSVGTVSKLVSEEPSVAAGTLMQETVRGLGRARSVDVNFVSGDRGLCFDVSVLTCLALCILAPLKASR